MRAVIQRVTSASVSVNNEIISQISRGLMVLVGIGADDNASDVELMSKKMYVEQHPITRSLSLRVFSDNTEAMWKASVKDIDGDILCVSQFTLMANTTKKKPDFHRAMSTEPSRELYATFLDKLRLAHHPDKVKDGRFGAMMNVSLTNEGPVTFTLDTRKFEYVDQPVSRDTKGAQQSKTLESSHVNDALTAQ